MDFCDAVRKGSIAGFCVGLVLILLIFLTDSATSMDLSSIAIFILFPVICGAVIGSLIFLVYSGVSWTYSFISLGLWSVLSECGILVNSLYGWTFVVIAPIFLIVYKYFLRKSPEWIEESSDQIMTWFLASLGIFLLQLLFPFLGR